MPIHDDDLTDAPVEGDAEAYKTLLKRVGKASPKIPPDALVRHVLGCVPAEEWPVRVEALEAILRRLESVKKDGLRINARPERGRPLGAYTTGRRQSNLRPYCTVFHGVDPIDARCDCPDFLKNSLGLCKHVLTILEHLYTHPRLLRQALKQRADEGAGGRAGLSWNPFRPLTGLGDWLERVSYVGPDDPRASRPARWARALAHFRAGPEGALIPRDPAIDDPPKRLTLVEDLLRVVPNGNQADGGDPALRALLQIERERLRRRAKQTLSAAELRAAFKGMKCPLYPYQRDGVERFLAQGRLLLADDMGLGKTAQAIACCDILWRTRRIRRGLVIVPASLKPQWHREWMVFSDQPVRVIDGTPTERQAIYETRRSGLFIINYEQLLRDLEIIRGWGPDLVVLDEAQRIKNWATKTALSVKGLSPAYRLVLTGTPMENRIEELASVVEWVDDMALEPKWRLGALHAIHADGKHDTIGVRHLDTLRERLKRCMVRRVRQDVLDQLPPRTDVRVPVELTGPQRGEHDALIPPIASLANRARKRPLTQVEFLRLMSLLTSQRIISNGLAQLNFEEIWPGIKSFPPEESMIQGLSTPKLLEFRQLVRQLVIEQGRKVVVFSQWRRMLTLAQWSVTDLLAEVSSRAAFFTGAEGQRRRTQNIVEFHDDPACRILFATDAGGVGLNLQHAANSMINLELPWNPAVLEQRIGRIYRIGQAQPIDVYNLVSEDGIESRIATLVGSKQAFFKGLFDGESDSVQFNESSSFLAKIEKLYEDALAADAAADAGSVAEDGGPIDLVDDLEDLDDLTDPFDIVIADADESGDVPALPGGTSEVDETPAAAAATPAGSHAAPTPSRAVAAFTTPSPTPTTGEVRQLVSQLRIRREEGGKVVIEAPPEAASTLSALFEGMAALLQAASVPPADETPRSG